MLASIAAGLALAALLAGRWREFSTAISTASAWVLGVAVVLQLVALLARTEAWQLCVRAAGGTVSRRRLYRASSMGYVGSIANGQLGVVARLEPSGCLFLGHSESLTQYERVRAVGPTVYAQTDVGRVLQPAGAGQRTRLT